MSGYLRYRKWTILVGLSTALAITAVPDNWQLRLKNTYENFPVVAALPNAQNRQLSPLIGVFNWQTGRLDGWLKRNPLLKPTITIRDGVNIEIFEPEQQTLAVNKLMTTLFRVINGRANGTVEPRQLKNNVPFVVYSKGLNGEFIKAIIDRTCH